MEESRRAFLKKGPALTALSQSRVLGANERIRIAGLGCGGRCQFLLALARQAPGTEIVAACDVYGPRRAETRAKVAPTAQEHVDYREALERKDIDAVIIGSPDHWHVPMTVDAVRAGKDVYVEKPLTKTVEEGPLVEKAVAETGRIVQVGYQQRSWDHFRMAREVIAAGKLGKITLVLSSWYQNYLRYDPKPAVDAAKLDWKRWLGSAPDQPVNALRYHRWRWFWDFGGGHLTDLHSHYGDVIHWCMNADAPLDAQALGDSYALGYECPDTVAATWHYPGFTLVYTGTLVGHLEGGNIIFRGSRAMMKINRDGFAVYPEGVIAAEKTNYPEPEIEMRSLHDGSIDHVRNFLDCVRSRKAPNAPVGPAVAAARAAHLGNLAFRKGVRVVA
ncbi:MAG: Gfo/Idh/MocA family oxidoreductase [Acidobacteria bacterium]|nr:Gfo/Idh/MocA family oxidoreductase [Acidobacteriota bacterium]